MIPTLFKAVHGARRNASAGGGGALGPTYLDPSYDNYMGKGDRRFSDMFIPTTTAVGGGVAPARCWALIDGTTGNQFWFGAGETDREVVFSFPHPVRITEVTWRQNASNTHGTWRWQGSNDQDAWIDIGEAFTLGGATVQLHTELAGNAERYKHYRLLQVSGSTSSTPYITEVEFKIDQREGGEPVSFANAPYGSGDRSALIACTSDGFSGSASHLVNGTNALSFYCRNVTDAWVQFDFGSPVRVGAAKLERSTAHGSGTWVVEGSNDASDWTQLSDEVLMDAEILHWPFYDNVTAYRYYRLRMVSGNGSTSPYWLEIYFAAEAV